MRPVAEIERRLKTLDIPVFMMTSMARRLLSGRLDQFLKIVGKNFTGQGGCEWCRGGGNSHYQALKAYGMKDVVLCERDLSQ